MGGCAQRIKDRESDLDANINQRKSLNLNFFLTGRAQFKPIGVEEHARCLEAAVNSERSAVDAQTRERSIHEQRVHCHILSCELAQVSMQIQQLQEQQQRQQYQHSQGGVLEKKFLRVEIGYAESLPFARAFSACTERERQRHFVAALLDAAFCVPLPLSNAGFASQSSQSSLQSATGGRKTNALLCTAGQPTNYPQWFEVLTFFEPAVQSLNQSILPYEQPLQYRNEDLETDFRQNQMSVRSEVKISPVHTYAGKAAQPPPPPPPPSPPQIEVQNLQENLTQSKIARANKKVCAITDLTLLPSDRVTLLIGTKIKRVNQRVVWGRCDLPAAALLDQQVHEFSLEVNVLSEQTRDYGQYVGAMKLWVRAQYVYDKQKLFSEQTQQLSEYAQQLKQTLAIFIQN